MKPKINIFVVFISVFVAVGLIVASISWARDLTWVGCGISKKAFMGSLAAAYEKKTGVKIKLEGGGATRGIVDVAAGKADIGGTCRHAVGRPEEQGVKLISVGWDALVVIAHPSNNVKGLTVEQLKGIYLGKIKNWKELGGADQKIMVIARTGKISGVGLMFREMVFNNPEQEFTPTAKLVEESEGVEKLVEGNANAIAVTGISSAQKRKIKMFDINGKTPTRENIVNGSYLLYRPLYLVVKEPPTAEVQKFVAFALSEEGQAVIKGEGTVTLKEGAKLWGPYKQQIKKSGTTLDAN